MNKKELVNELSQTMNNSKADAERTLNGVLECIKQGLKKDGVVQLIGFGSFNVRKRKARKGRNPKSGETIKIKPTKTVTFKIGKAFKDKL